MTDYDRCLVAADWRLERLTEAIEATGAISTTHDLTAERKRLEAFANFCLLAKEFDGGAT
jgi:hypothetical protein